MKKLKLSSIAAVVFLSSFACARDESDNRRSSGPQVDDPVSNQNSPDPVSNQNSPDPVSNQNSPDPVSNQNSPKPVSSDPDKSGDSEITGATYEAWISNLLLKRYKIKGGSSIFFTDEAGNIESLKAGGGRKSIVKVSGKPFARAVELAISSVPEKARDAGLELSTKHAIRAGDRLLLIFWARTVSGPNQIGLGNFQFMLSSSPFTKFRAFEQRIGTEWKRYILPVQVTEDIPAGGAKFMVELGVAKQTIQLAGVTAINYGKSYAMASLPIQSNDEYVGREADAPWRKAAQERIEKFRKANLEVAVLSAGGQPIPNAQVRIEMLRHEFAFGTAIQEERIAGNSKQDDKYQEKLLNLDGKGHGFNTVVLENGHKWVQWENIWPLSHQNNARTVNWLKDKGIEVRGHTLLWGGWGNLPADMKGQSLPQLRKRIYDHMGEMLNYPGLKGVVKEWDVLNEPTGNVDIANAFKGSDGYPSGREFYVDVFKKAREIAPNVKAYINEAQLTNFYCKNDFYKSIVKDIVKGGAVIDGVGFQAHFRYLIPPAEMLEHFEDYHLASNGGKIRITEYDNATLAPDDIQSDYFRDILTATFSYEHSDGFLMWGFWDGTSKKAPLFDIDWNLKPFAKPFIDLVFNDWWTPTTELTSDANGKVALRGFKGTYKITITNGGEQRTEIVKLGGDTTFASRPVN
ncbi:MAG: endo-1,4-beta-xylanase [Pseudobdellovibrionaceae bacterium]|nr:endo-1,4-beta-xylanase [Pseudobdellovibrionaceae bacterium]